MAEYVLQSNDNQGDVARGLLAAAEDPSQVHWAPRPDTPHGGVFVVPDELAETYRDQAERDRKERADDAKTLDDDEWRAKYGNDVRPSTEDAAERADGDGAGTARNMRGEEVDSFTGERALGATGDDPALGGRTAAEEKLGADAGHEVSLNDEGDEGDDEPEADATPRPRRARRAAANTEDQKGE